MYIGDLSKLTVVHLGHNYFTGSIPSTMCNHRIIYLDTGSNLFSCYADCLTTIGYTHESFFHDSMPVCE